MKALKFDVTGRPDVSEAVQFILFALGYEWIGGHTEIRTGVNFLFAESDGYITYTSDRKDFNEDPSEEVKWIRQAAYPVRLSDEYIAIFEGGKVMVGGRSFDFNTVERLYEAVQKAREGL